MQLQFNMILAQLYKASICETFHQCPHSFFAIPVLYHYNFSHYLTNNDFNNDTARYNG